MLTELRGKAGRLCQEARNGQIRCPLIVRPTSEDVITGHLLGTLAVLNPRWWLSDLLNLALGTQRFPRQFHRRLRMEPWENRPRYPKQLLPWEEGSTQVDATLRWENPPTTVYVEAKYGADLSMTTAGNNGDHRYPADQLLRNIRVGLYECGWFNDARLFDLTPRDFVAVLWGPKKGHELVQKYRDPEQLRAAIPHSDRLVGFPTLPFVGELSYQDVIDLLRRQRCWFSRPEQKAIDTFCDYLTFKLASLRQKPGPGQVQISFCE